MNIAHRGASGHFPENTLASFAGALDAGADTCELDVRMTRDRVLVVMHDERVERTTDGRGTVAALTLAELEPALRVGLLAERAPNRMLAAAAAMGAFAVHPAFGLASAALCAEAHRRGLQVYVWTVDDEQEMRRLIAVGVDGIMTNFPERLRALGQG